MNRMPSLTDFQRKALTLIRDHEIAYARQFGELLWGRDHPSWRKTSKAGPHGSTVGGGMNLASGACLGKLRKQGLISFFGGQGERYRLTEKGRKLLDEESK
jgi:hypothetical protein